LQTVKLRQWIGGRKTKAKVAKGTHRWQKERESCCFLCSLSFRASGGNKCNEKLYLLFPLELPCIFRWQMTTNTLCKKTKINHVSQNHSCFLFHCHARQHYHVGVSNGS